MSRIYQIEQPSSALNKPLHDIPLEDNAALLSGYCSDVGVISNGVLCVGFMDSIQALYGSDGQTNVFFNDYYPIGSQIYVYIGDETFNDEDVFAKKFYSSYYDVPINANGGAWDHMDDEDDVFLVAELNANKTHWKPIGLIGTSELNPNYHTGKCLIRLGSTKGQYNVPPYTDCDKFMLEEHKPMFYYDGTDLIPFDVWLLTQSQGFFRNYRRTTDIQFTNNAPIQSWDTDGETFPAGKYLLSGQFEFVNDYSKCVNANVILRYKIGVSGTWQFISAADVAVIYDTSGGKYTHFNIQGVFDVASASTVIVSMLIEVPPTAASQIYIPSTVPAEGTHLESLSYGPQMFVQRVGNAN